jgi:hypothetical protein
LSVFGLRQSRRRRGDDQAVRSHVPLILGFVNQLRQAR